MKILTVKQPHLWLILTGSKPIENRGQQTHYRGRVMLHASAKPEPRSFVAGVRGAYGLDRADGLLTGPDFPTDDHFRSTCGMILGSVEIVDCIRVNDLAGNAVYNHLAGHWSAAGPWCWIMREPQWLAEPTPHKGQLGLREYKEEVRA